MLAKSKTARAALRVLESSKYIELWVPPVARAEVAADYVRSWGPPISPFNDLLFAEHRGAQTGTIGASLVYPKTWQIHHLALDSALSDGAIRKRHIRDLISGIFKEMETHLGLEWFIAYSDSDKGLNDKLYTSFVKSFGDRTRTDVSFNEVYRRDTSGREIHSGRAGVPMVVTTGSPAAFKTLCVELDRTTTQLERDAMSLNANELDLSGFSAMCSRVAAYERGRRIFFTERAGVPSAALLLESGNAGQNLFGLFNSCRVIPLISARDFHLEETALLRRAALHYRTLGKSQFLYIRGEKSTIPTRVGFEHVSGGLRWIGHRSVIPVYIKHLEATL